MTIALALAAVVIVAAFAAWLVRLDRSIQRAYEMPGCLRCSRCGVSWPVGKDFQPCPVCLGKTDRVADEPIDAVDAHSRMTHGRFERWLDEHGRRDPVEVLERIPVKGDA